MSFKNVPAGKQIPEDIFVVIEISANSQPVKYEIEKDQGVLYVDRFVSTAMFYPANYGYINNTLSEDGDPVDVLVITPHPVVPGSVVRARPVGVFKMTDESGVDAKIIAVPHSKLTPAYDNIQNIEDVPELLKQQISNFFANYKALEPGKWVEIVGYEGIEEAKKEIIASLERYQNG